MGTLLILINASKEVRPYHKEVWNGKEYLVAPMTLIVPGVLDGSEGPLYYPPDETGKDYNSWDGMPLVAYHPMGKDGKPVSARNPAVLENQQIGNLFNAHLEDDESNGIGNILRGEGWFDVDKTAKIDNSLHPDIQILPRLIAGKPIEISTGLFTDNEPAPEGATFNGIPYKYIARNYRPDHIAILPDETGACSLKDGCGVYNSDNTVKDNSSCTCNVNKEHTKLTDNKTIWKLISKVTNSIRQPRSKNSGKFKRYGAGTGKGLAHEFAQSGFLTITEKHKELGRDAAKQKAELNQNPPSWAVDESKWEKAKAAAAKSGHEEDWPYVVAIYQNMGGRVGNMASNSNKKNKSTSKKDITNKDYPWGKCMEDQMQQYGDEETAKKVCASIKAKNNSKDTAMDKKALVNWLTTNCDCWKDKDSRETLNKFSEDKLKKLKQVAENSSKLTIIVNRVNDNKKKSTDNAGDNMEVAGVDIAGLAQFLGIEVDPASDPVGFINALQDKLDEVQSKLRGEEETTEGEMPPQAMSESTNSTEEETVNSEEETVVEETPKQNHRVSRITLAEWEASMPAEARAIWNTAKENVNKERNQLIKKLTANISDPKKRQQRIQKLMKLDIGELRDQVEQMPKSTTANRKPAPRTAEEYEQFVTANYIGGAGGPINNHDDAADDILPLPGEELN